MDPTNTIVELNGDLVDVFYKSERREFSFGFRISEIVLLLREEEYAEGGWRLTVGVLLKGAVYDETKLTGNYAGINAIYDKLMVLWADHVKQLAGQIVE